MPIWLLRCKKMKLRWRSNSKPINRANIESITTFCRYFATSAKNPSAGVQTTRYLPIKIVPQLLFSKCDLWVEKFNKSNTAGFSSIFETHHRHAFLYLLRSSPGKETVPINGNFHMYRADCHYFLDDDIKRKQRMYKKG